MGRLKRGLQVNNEMDAAVHDSERLKELQGLPLDRKIMITQARIIEWYRHYGGNVYVGFSGGKDSTVLLHLARQVFPDIPAVFINTGLEYPEIYDFARSFDNVTVVTPLWGKAGKRNGHLHTDRMLFSDVLSVYGYPIIGKEVSDCIGQARTNLRRGNFKSYRVNRINGNVKSKGSFMDYTKWKPLYYLPFLIFATCCDAMKKRTVARYVKQTGRYGMTGQLASESKLRRLQWLKYGCNGFVMKKPVSNPLSFWKERDILEYIKRYSLPICSLYGEVVWDKQKKRLKCTGCDRTGCVFCAYGFHTERGETRFQRLSRTHPRLYEYCLEGGQWVENPSFDALITDREYWNPKKIWVPSKSGLGMRCVFDMCNGIYGRNFMRYE